MRTHKMLRGFVQLVFINMVIVVQRAPVQKRAANGLFQISYTYRFPQQEYRA